MVVGKKRKRWEVAIPRFTDAKHSRVVLYLQGEDQDEDAVQESELAQAIQQLHAAFHVKEDIAQLSTIFQHFSQTSDTDPSAASIKADMLALEHEKDLLFDRLQEIAKAEALELAAEHNGALFGGLLATSSASSGCDSSESHLEPQEERAGGTGGTETDGTESLGTEGANGDRFGDGAISADDASVRGPPGASAVSSYIIDAEDYLDGGGGATSGPDASPAILDGSAVAPGPGVAGPADPWMVVDDEPGMDCGFLDDAEVTSPQTLVPFGPTLHPRPLGRAPYAAAMAFPQAGRPQSLPPNPHPLPQHVPYAAARPPVSHLHHFLLQRVPLLQHRLPPRPRYSSLPVYRRPYYHQPLQSPPPMPTEVRRPFSAVGPLTTQLAADPDGGAYAPEEPAPDAADHVDAAPSPTLPPATAFRRPPLVPFRPPAVLSLPGRLPLAPRPFPRPAPLYRPPLRTAFSSSASQARLSSQVYRQVAQRLLLALPGRPLADARRGMAVVRPILGLPRTPARAPPPRAFPAVPSRPVPATRPAAAMCPVPPEPAAPSPTLPSGEGPPAAAGGGPAELGLDPVV